MTIPHTCRICRIAISLEPHPDCPELKIAGWLPLVVCNRCAEFRQWVWRAEKGVNAVCHRYWLLKCHGKEKDFTAEVRDRLNTLTRVFADRVCRHYGVATKWEPDFVQQLLDMPEKALGILAVYEKLIAKSARRTSSMEMACQRP